MEQCIFCAMEPEIPQILFTTPHFYVKMGHGLVTAGHVLLIPKEHYTCFGALPASLDTELEKSKDRLKQIITQYFASPILIEYGVWGQTVPHAHIHFIPKQGPRHSIDHIVDAVAAGSGIEPLPMNQALLRKYYSEIGPNVGMEENGLSYAFPIVTEPNELQQQFLRYRPFLHNMGLDVPVSWSAMNEQERAIDEEKRLVTKDILKGKSFFMLEDFKTEDLAAAIHTPDLQGIGR